MSRILIVCSDNNHPIYPRLLDWIEHRRVEHEIELVQRISMYQGSADFLFLISCSEIIPAQGLEFFTYRLVIHASDLPQGRGWSPLVWQVLEGQREITVSLLDAQEPVDSGAIWKKVHFSIEAHEVLSEINEKLFAAELSLMDFALSNAETIQPQPQNTIDNAKKYPKRNPEDSRIDVEKSIREQFDLLRISDPQRYPAFFELHGHKYALKLEKIDSE